MNIVKLITLWFVLFMQQATCLHKTNHWSIIILTLDKFLSQLCETWHTFISYIHLCIMLKNTIALHACNYCTDASIVPPFFHVKFVLKRGWGFTRVPGLARKFSNLNIANTMIMAHYKNKLIFTLVYWLKWIYLKKSFLLSSNCFIFADDHGIFFALDWKKI